MDVLRTPAVAGAFYPADPKQLEDTVDALVAAAAVPAGKAPAALLVPHAGYRYSGPVAASGYRRVADAGHRYRSVVVACPNHTMPVAGIALSGADAWKTPLGRVPVDRARRAGLAAAGLAVVDDAPHRGEHAVEVHLPFLQRVLAPGWVLLPVVVGSVPAASIAGMIDAACDDATLLVVSSDLSHYLPYDEAVRRDRTTVEAIVARRGADIAPDDACGRNPLHGFLASQLAAGLAPEVLDVRNSGDTSGNRRRVVGYAAISFAAR